MRLSSKFMHDFVINIVEIRVLENSIDEEIF